MEEAKSSNDPTPLPPLPQLPPLPPVPPVPPLPPIPTPEPPVPCPEMEPAIYKAEREILLELIKENTAQHDKAVLQLAAGALALSVTFLTDIAKNPEGCTYGWLGFGWVFLVVSMICIVASFVAAIANQSGSITN